MNILSVDNTVIDLNMIGTEDSEDTHFFVLDNSNPRDPDFFALPLLYLESYNWPALVIAIGPYKLTMPANWHVLIADKECGDAELVKLSSVNNRGFDTFCSNPISNKTPHFLPLKVLDVYTDFRYIYPKMKSGNILAVPLHSEKNPLCAYFCEDINKSSEVVSIDKIW